MERDEGIPLRFSILITQKDKSRGNAMLYPKMTKTRMKFSLDGIWEFKLIEGKDEVKRTRPMPVPSSYNDIYPEKKFRIHVGDMMYQRELWVTPQMRENSLILRFGSVTHKAKVYINDIFLGEHLGGFLPFEFDLTDKVFDGKNLLKVYVNNIVDRSTLPVGRLVSQTFPEGEVDRANLPNFDFFNYSGIMRPVCLYTRPLTYIKDITVIGKQDKKLLWKIQVEGEEHASTEILIRVLDTDGNSVFEGKGAKGEERIEEGLLWEPETPILYSMEVSLIKEGKLLDQYIEKFGFREVEIRDCRIYLNNKPVYLKGFGKHEDTPVHGRGYNTVYNVKDVALLKWIGANSFRSSHYPYSEEMLELCDQEGIMVIDEAPAVGLHTGFSATGMLNTNPSGTWEYLQTAQHHRDVIRDMIERDKNHPCVIMWSLANEPASEEEGAREYFEPLFDLARKQDPQKRPVTVVTYEGASPEKCRVTDLCDMIVINRYRGWYDTEGNLKGAAALLKEELERFHKRYPTKPIMLGEYGVDTIAGMHDIYQGLFSEEYQMEFLKTYSRVFDNLSYIVGEHIWNFADFSTAENIKRVQGNKKGIFTRTREPKMAAFYIRERWNKNKEKQ